MQDLIKSCKIKQWNKICIFVILKIIVMNIEADIKWITEELKTVKDPILIEAFKNMLKYRKKITQPSKRISIEQYNKEVNEAITRVENGEFYTQEEAEKIMDNW